jgi:hypothetical protein
MPGKQAAGQWRWISQRTARREAETVRREQARLVREWLTRTPAEREERRRVIRARAGLVLADVA